MCSVDGFVFKHNTYQQMSFLISMHNAYCSFYVIHIPGEKKLIN